MREKLSPGMGKQASSALTDERKAFLGAEEN